MPRHADSFTFYPTSACILNVMTSFFFNSRYVHTRNAITNVLYLTLHYKFKYDFCFVFIY